MPQNPHQILSRSEEQRAETIRTFYAEHFQDTLDLETFLRSSNLPFAIEEYIRQQNYFAQSE